MYVRCQVFRRVGTFLPATDYAKPSMYSDLRNGVFQYYVELCLDAEAPELDFLRQLDRDQLHSEDGFIIVNSYEGMIHTIENALNAIDEMGAYETP